MADLEGVDVPDSTLLTAERLREIIVYNPDTGVFTWRISRGRAGAGNIAGTLDTGGYWRILILGRKQAAHRLAWLYMTGEWPEHDIDHKNTVRNDNRWVNLRKGTRSENCQNQQRAKVTNASGYLGVRLDKRSGRYAAEISANGRKHWLGYHPTAEAAYEAYLAAKRELHPFGML